MTAGNKTPARLELEPTEMRRVGYKVIDMIVDHLCALPDKTATGFAHRTELEEKLREPAPESAGDIEQVLHTVEHEVLEHTMWCNHPRHFAWVPGPSNFVGALGDLLASGYNMSAGSWMEAAGAGEIEVLVLDWIRDWLSMPETASGIFVSGGSMANLTGIATARHVWLEDRIDDAVIYCTEQAHSSVVRNLRVLGFQSEQIRRIPVGQDLRMRMDALGNAVAEDKTNGRRPFCVIATGGTTNTATVDPLNQIADFCETNELWFHIDGAYGAAAVLTDKGKILLNGIQRAHSVALDPHKWLFQPFEMGCCMVRDSHWLERTFSERPEYLQDTWADRDNEEVSFGDRGVQLTRGFRALKLWMTIKVFGMDALRAAVQQGIDNAERVEAIINEHGCFEIITPAQLGVITFRYRVPADSTIAADDLTRAIYNANRERGYSMLTTTLIRGQNVLRICAINPRTTEADLRGTIELLARLGEQACAAAL